MLSSHLFKTEFKIDEEFNTKGMQNNGIWNHTPKGLWEILTSICKVVVAL